MPKRNHREGQGASGRERAKARVYEPGTLRPKPQMRTRPASMAPRVGLAFEPEAGDQKEALARALAPGPVPLPGIPFEAELGEPAKDEAEKGRSLQMAPDHEGEAELALLRDLAAERPSQDTAPVSASVGSPPRQARAEPLRQQRLTPRPAPPGIAASDRQAPAAVPDTPRRRNWISVFLSEQVAGRTRARRGTAPIPRQSGTLIAVAERTASWAWRTAKRVVLRTDEITTRARLPLAGIFWSAVVAGLTMLFGLEPAAAGAVFAGGLIFTATGQPARNLLAVAGVLILATTLAEIVRQRERFTEIFLDLFGEVSPRRHGEHGGRRNFL